MKRFVLILSMLAVSAFAADNEMRVGPQIASDGVKGVVSRSGKEGQQITGDLHGRFYEAASRGALFTASTPLTGTTAIVAGNVSPVAAAAVVWLAVYNPVGSGVNLEILKGAVTHLTGTPGTGSWGWNLGCSQAITANETAGVIANNKNPLGSGRAKAYLQVALTGSTALTLIRQLPKSNVFAAAIAAGTVEPASPVDDVEGAIVVEPGCVVALAAPAVGTTVVASGFITYNEVPIP